MNDIQTSNKSRTVIWEDDLYRDSYVVVLHSYGDLQLLKVKPVDGNPNAVELTVYGSAESVDAFYDDYLEDSFCVLEALSAEFADNDDEYVAALKFNAELINATNGWPTL